MKKLLVCFLSLALICIGCSKNQSITTIEELNQIWDETTETTDNLWFMPPNLDFSNFKVTSDNQKITYRWTVTFHEKFYQKLIEKNPTIYYKLLFPSEVSAIVNMDETEFYFFQPFKPDGKRKYSIKINIDTDSTISEEVIEHLNDIHDYTLMIYDENFTPLSNIGLSKISQDTTIYYE